MPSIASSALTTAEHPGPPVGEAGTPAAAFYQWALKRYQRRAARLAWALLSVVVVSAVVFATLFVRLQAVKDSADAASLSAERAHARIEKLEQERPATQREITKAEEKIAATSACLERQVADLQELIRRLVDRKLSPERFLEKDLRGCG